MITTTQRIHLERPDYQALDAQGLEYTRKARTIGELPHDDRGQALEVATTFIASLTGLKAVKRIPFGTPVFMAFEGLTRPKAKHHPHERLLLTHGTDVELDYYPSYSVNR